MSAAGPLQNRVDPYGELVATPARGALMGNRGGRFHRRRPDPRAPPLGLAGNGSPASAPSRAGGAAVWGDSYTELFFLDEATALAAGHRPCFECRRAEAEAFRRAFGDGARPKRAEMDAILHRERLATAPSACGTRRSSACRTAR